MIESEHDNFTEMKAYPCSVRSNWILDALVKGGEYKPKGIDQQQGFTHCRKEQRNVLRSLVRGFTCYGCRRRACTAGTSDQ